MKLKIPSKELAELIINDPPTFPKYTTQLLNLANQNTGGTRPKNVGQMTDLINEFEGDSFADWEKWYLETHPDAIKIASKKALEMISNLKKAIDLIDEEMAEKYIKDLVINKTFLGLKFQEAILKKVASQLNTTYKASTSAEEAQGIDGYIGETPVSIKPITYRVKNALPENIECTMIYYDKKKTGLIIEFEL
jgi:hypothetical protein